LAQFMLTVSWVKSVNMNDDFNFHFNEGLEHMAATDWDEL